MLGFEDWGDNWLQRRSGGLQQWWNCFAPLLWWWSHDLNVLSKPIELYAQKWLFSMKILNYMLKKTHQGWNSLPITFSFVKWIPIKLCQLEALKGDKKAWRRNLLLPIWFWSLSVSPSFFTLPGKLVPISSFTLFWLVS